jgi:hypothetical protein
LDVKSYDTGVIIIGITTPSGATTAGELYCDYSLIFETPQLDDDSPDVARIVTSHALNTQNPFSDTTRPGNKAAINLLDDFVTVEDGNSLKFSKPSTPYQVVTQIIGTGLGTPIGWTSYSGGGTIDLESQYRSVGDDLTTLVANLTTSATASTNNPNQFNVNFPLVGTLISALTQISALNTDGFVI